MSTFDLVFPNTANQLNTTVFRIIPVANLSSFAPVSISPNAATYVYNAGDAKDVVTADFRRSYDPRTGYSQGSIALSTDIRETITETGAMIDHPVEAKIVFRWKGEFCPSLSEYKLLVEALMGLYCSQSDGSNHPVGGAADMIDRGILSKMF